MTTTTVSSAAISLLHILLAVGVTSHALLHKRDEGSAIAWIGLAWLAPRMALPQAAARTDHLAPLEYADQRITQRPAQSGNAIAILHNGDQAYPKMIAAIDAARRSIALSTYIFRAIDPRDATRRRSARSDRRHWRRIEHRRGEPDMSPATPARNRYTFPVRGTGRCAAQVTVWRGL